LQRLDHELTAREFFMPVLQFKSADDVVRFAEAFLDEHLERFRKDIAICLTPDAKNSHAYFPALITCIAFAELLSSLYAGKLDGTGLEKLKDYVSKFMNTTAYNVDRLDILYECFRHKVAHLAQPYAVFDTYSKKTFRTQPKRFITWTVLEYRRRPAIKIVPKKCAKQIKKAVTPWPVFYDHRVYISVPTLASDIIDSIPRYLERLRTDQAARDRFKKCMEHIYPR
jgi:hypothetical protein